MAIFLFLLLFDSTWARPIHQTIFVASSILIVSFALIIFIAPSSSSVWSLRWIVWSPGCYNKLVALWFFLWLHFYLILLSSILRCIWRFIFRLFLILRYNYMVIQLGIGVIATPNSSYVTHLIWATLWRKAKSVSSGFLQRHLRPMINEVYSMVFHQRFEGWIEEHNFLKKIGYVELLPALLTDVEVLLSIFPLWLSAFAEV